MYLTSYYPPMEKKYIEGVGAYYQRIISFLAITKRHNSSFKYIHIPIKIGHNYDNDPEWDEKWDKMFNIIKLSNNDEIDINNMEKNYNEINNFTLDNIANTNTTTLYYYENRNILLDIFDKNPEYYLANIQEQIIEAYDENNNNRKLIYDKNKINIAIHLRVYNDYDDEGNLTNYTNNYGSRYTYTCDMYIKLINQLKDKYPNSDIHIFSQEKYFDLKFKVLREVNNINIHFDDLEIFDVFHHLCKADVLVMGLSSLSILAAFYNKNTVIYLNYCHPPSLSSWIVYENNLPNDM